MNRLKAIIPNSFTTGNMLGGIMAIILIFSGRIDLAPWCIFASAIFDFFDGFLARMLKVNSELGKQLDSLADMITFGVAPGILIFGLLIYSILLNTPDSLEIIGLEEYSSERFLAEYNNSLNLWIFDTVSNNEYSFELKHFNPMTNYFPFLGLLFPIFALFRLAKFNIDTRQSDSFIGLPTPGATLFFAVFPIILSGNDGTLFLGNGPTELLLNPYFLIISTIVISVLMVSELPLFALKFKHFKWKGNEVRFIFLALALVLIATLFFWSIPVIIILYLLISVVSYFSSKNKQTEVKS